MEIFFTILVEFGLPVAASTVMGFFIYLVIKYILESVVGQVNGMHGIIMGLENRVKNMNNDMIKLDIQISDALNLRQDEEKKSADAAAARAEKNTTINKFIANVESRIYANLSKQLVDNMFGTTCDSSTTTCPTSGTATVEGAQIYWVKDTSTEIITLTITDVDGTTTTMTVPLGDFKF